MENYYLLRDDVELMDLINTVNKVSNLMMDSGKDHTMFVVNSVEYILTRLGYDEHIIELGKISALLHDIGNLTGKNDHALKSSEMSEYFLNKTTLTGYDKKRIMQAIRDHSNGEEIDTPFGAALLLADKVDFNRERVLPKGKNDSWHKNVLEIDHTEIIVEDNKVFINRLVSETFSEEMMNSWKKGIAIPMKACKYLECECIFQCNGKIKSS